MLKMVDYQKHLAAKIISEDQVVSANVDTMRTLTTDILGHISPTEP